VLGLFNVRVIKAKKIISWSSPEYTVCYVNTYFLHVEPGYRSRYSDQATEWRVRCSGSGRDKTLSPKPPVRLWGPPSLLFSGHGVLSAEIKKSPGG
jgi:hypothetical protein